MPPSVPPLRPSLIPHLTPSPSSSTLPISSRPSSIITSPPCNHHIQTRNATFLARPKRPYTFTQLVTLSDGSTYTQRTTSPQPTYLSTRDTRNAPLWNPTSKRLLNVEQDEAGKLKRFRDKFGNLFDAKGPAGGMEGIGGKKQRGRSPGTDAGAEQGAAAVVAEAAQTTVRVAGSEGEQGAVGEDDGASGETQVAAGSPRVTAGAGEGGSSASSGGQELSPQQQKQQEEEAEVTEDEGSLMDLIMGTRQGPKAPRAPLGPKRKTGEVKPVKEDGKGKKK